MPHEIQFENLPAGYATTNFRKDEMGAVVTREFSSSEDGNLFISRLEGLPRQVISKIPGAGFGIESTVDHLFAIIRPDKTATVFLNDLPYSLMARTKRAINAGDPVTLDHILDVTKVKLNGVSVPPEAGLIIILSAGWRKGLFFDLTPLVGKGPPRTYDVETTLGQYYTYLHFQHLLGMEDTAWDIFFQQGWFPFIHLRQTTLQGMVNYARAGFQLDEHLDQIATETRETVAAQLDGWKTHSLLAPHHALLEAAFREFVEGDFVSAAAILYPRIEGVLRSNHFAEPSASGSSQGKLITSAIARAALPHGNSLLLPERFRRYLREIYFAEFDPMNPTGLNRNTIAHGVAPQAAFDRKGVVVGFQILLQIVAMLPPDQQPAAKG